jgi:hypothetical protein
MCRECRADKTCRLDCKCPQHRLSIDCEGRKNTGRHQNLSGRAHLSDRRAGNSYTKRSGGAGGNEASRAGVAGSARDRRERARGAVGTGSGGARVATECAVGTAQANTQTDRQRAALRSCPQTRRCAGRTKASCRTYQDTAPEIVLIEPPGQDRQAAALPEPGTGEYVPGVQDVQLVPN